MAVFERRFYFPDSPALASFGGVFLSFFEKLGVPFRVPSAAGDFLVVVYEDALPILFMSFEPLPCARPVFNLKAINGTSAFSTGILSDSAQQYVSEVLDEIQSLQKGERCSIVLSSTRRGWLKWSKTYGFYYIGRHQDTAMFCFERA